MAKNVNMTVSQNVLTITIDLSKDFGTSASGKSLSVASTEGNCDLTDLGASGVKVGINVYKPLPRDQRQAPKAGYEGKATTTTKAAPSQAEQIASLLASLNAGK